MSDDNGLLRVIADEWWLDAKSEEVEKYFYNYEDVKSVLLGRNCYVIGRKGSGKTAISEHITNSKKYGAFSTKLSFKNFPFNDLYKLEDSRFTKPNQYITLWKFLIYCNVCKLMRDNEALPPEVTSTLVKVLPNRTIHNLSSEINSYIKGGSFQILGCGMGFERESGQPQQIEWHEAVDVLESFILNNCTRDYTYYVVFDELDEDYNVYGLKERRTEYFMLLTSLLKAVMDVKNTIRRSGLRIFPIVFLRDDIYRLIEDADKNKWRDYELSLTWSLKDIERMLAHRLAAAAGDNPVDADFMKYHDQLFKSRKVRYGTGKSKATSTLEYISFSTLLRPRDFISFIKLCSQEALRRGLPLINQDVIHNIDRSFSNYFRGEIRDEISPVIPDIDAIFSAISRSHKMIISQDDFRKELQILISEGALDGQLVNNVIETLFEFSIIGNLRNGGKHKTYFKHTHSNMTWNNREPVVIHRGLLKSLHLE